MHWYQETGIPSRSGFAVASSTQPSLRQKGGKRAASAANASSVWRTHVGRGSSPINSQQLVTSLEQKTDSA